MKKDQTIAIIGLGAEGSWWKKFLENLRYEVLTSDSDSTNQAIVTNANIIILAVPMSCSVEVISSLVFRDDQLIISVVGEMMSSCRALEATPSEWVQIHRMCGPRVATMQGQNIILGEMFLGKWETWVQVLLLETEATITRVTCEAHDQQTSITQCLMRLVAITVLMVMQKLEISFADTEASSSPPFRLMIAVIGRILKQGARLCFDMLTSNLCALDAITAAEQALHQVRSLILEKDRKGFDQMFGSVSQSFGEARIAHANALVDKIIDAGLDS